MLSLPPLAPWTQNRPFFPQKVLSEGEIDASFKQLFKQLAGPVRGTRGARRGGHRGDTDRPRFPP